MEPLPSLMCVSRVHFLSPLRGWPLFIFLCGPAWLAAKMAMPSQMQSSKDRSRGDTCLGCRTMGSLVVKPALETKADTVSNELQVRMGAGFPRCRSKNAACSLSEDGATA